LRWAGNPLTPSSALDLRVALSPAGRGHSNAHRPCYTFRFSDAVRLEPFFELRDHAMAVARNESSGLWGDLGCDEERQCWWATDGRGRQYRLVVEETAPAEIAAWGKACAAQ
jgi:hypothetical protein